MNRFLTFSIVLLAMVGCGRDEEGKGDSKTTDVAAAPECLADPSLVPLFVPGDRLNDAVAREPKLAGLLQCGWQSRYMDDEGREVRGWDWMWVPDVNRMTVVDGVIESVE